MMNEKKLENMVDKVATNQMTRREFLVTALAMGLSYSAIGTLLQSCAPRDEPTPAPGEEIIPTPTLATKLSMAQYSTHANVFGETVPIFKERTGIEVVIEEMVPADSRDKIVATHRGGTSPWDVITFWAQTGQEMAHRGWLVDLTDRVNALFKPNADDLLGGWSIFTPVTYKDRIYAVPFDGGCTILQWNKALLSERGLDPDRPAKWHEIPYSVDEFIEFAKACTFEKDGVPYYGYSAPWGNQVYGEMMWFTQMYGGDIMDLTKNQPWGEPTMNQEHGQKALQLMVDLLTKHEVMDPACVTYNWTPDYAPTYLDGRIAIISTWAYLTHVAQNPERSKIVGNAGFGCNFAAETSASWEGPEYQAISIFTPNGAEVAWKWLEHMSSQEMQKLQGLDGNWAPIWNPVLLDPEVQEIMTEGANTCKTDGISS
jgi:multiple sugar transport system substrate-binding protein